VAAYRYVMRGVVQGVGFRYFVLREARALGLTGYARNRGDGSVEVVAEGGTAALSELEDRLRVGPPSAVVTSLEREAAEPRGDPDFHIR
jgi:acylphosphatase